MKFKINIEKFTDAEFLEKVFDSVFQKLNAYSISQKRGKEIVRDIYELIINTHQHSDVHESILSIYDEKGYIVISYTEKDGNFYTREKTKEMFESRTPFRTKKKNKGGHGLKNYVLKHPDNIEVNIQKGELILTYKES